MSWIFISHVKEDEPEARALACALRDAGYDAWLFEDHSLPGLSYIELIIEAMREASAVIVVLSLRALRSNQVGIEIVHAHESKKILIPITKDLSYDEVRRQRPGWRMMMGAAVASPLPPTTADGVQLLAVSLRRLGIAPSSSHLRTNAGPRKHLLGCDGAASTSQGIEPDAQSPTDDEGVDTTKITDPGAAASNLDPIRTDIEGPILSHPSKSSRQTRLRGLDYATVWSRFCSSPEFSVLTEAECAWVIPWRWGIPTSRLQLVYRDITEKTYIEEASSTVVQALGRWQKQHGALWPKLNAEPWGEMARIEWVDEDQGNYRPTIHLAPTKFLHYLATHREVERCVPLRDAAYANAMVGIGSGEHLLMPSHFALHMLVISSERQILLRQRKLTAPFYGGAWEAGVGEFMHGPRTLSHIRHFKGVVPSVDLFLRGAVREELDYLKARPSDFRLYGFAVERDTLAPKLLVIYQSDETIEALRNGAIRTAADRAHDTAAVSLDLETIAGLLAGTSEYPRWGPTSKLLLVLAALQQAESESSRAALLARLSELVRSKRN